MTLSVAHSAQPTIEQVRTIPRTVVDPEICVNIVDLGLIYDGLVTPDKVSIAMTMTSPACPMGDLLVAYAEAALLDGPPVSIEVVRTPPWEPAMMSDKARDKLGW